MRKAEAMRCLMERSTGKPVVRVAGEHLPEAVEWLDQSQTPYDLTTLFLLDAEEEGEWGFIAFDNSNDAFAFNLAQGDL